MPGERTVLATLGTLGEVLAAEQVKPPAIIVIGDVVAVAHPERVRLVASPVRTNRRATLMATLIEIDDPADPRLADYRDLRDVELRKNLEAEHGLFLAEGEKVVRRAVEGGFAPRSFLMAPRWLDGLADVLATTDAPCYVLSEALAEQVTGFHVHRGALASLERRPLPPVEDVLAGARSVLVLEEIVDHTNVGAIFRGGARARLRRRAPRPAVRRPALPACDQGRHGRDLHDALDPAPRLVRRPPRLSAAGFTTVALTLADDATPVDEAVAGLDKVALVLGSEGHGSPPGGSRPPTGAPSSRCARGSTRSTSPPPRRSPLAR